MLNTSDLTDKLIAYFQRDNSYPIYPAFTEETFYPYGTVIVSVPEFTQEQPGIDDYIATIQVELYTSFQADRDGRLMDQMQYYFSNKLLQIEPQSEDFPDIVGVLQLSGKKSDAEPLRYMTFTLPVAISY